MMTISSCITKAREAIRDDDAIADWLEENLPGQTLHIYEGEDAANPVGESQAPFVVLSPGQPYDVGEQTGMRAPSFEVDWGIVSSATSQPEDDTATTIQTGYKLADELGHLIRAALLAEFGGDHFASVAFALFGASPLWEGGMTVTLTYTVGLAGEDA